MAYGGASGHTLLATYEVAVQDAIMDCLRPGDIFFDVGAHAGYFTLLGAKLVGTSGHVYFFEPCAQNIGQFNRIMALNKVSNCTLVPKAVSDRVSTTKLYLDPTSSYRASLHRIENGPVVEVESTDLDTFVAQHSVPCLIKLDVQGAEAQALSGATKLLSSRSAPTWIIKVHGPIQHLEAVRLLERHGDRVVELSALNSAPPDPIRATSWPANRPDRGDL